MHRKAKMAAGAPHPGETTPHSDDVDTEDIDIDWDVEQSVTRARKPREAMPTLHEDDPLRYDLNYDRKRDATRDSMPTLPDIDPLRHDVDEDDAGSSKR